MHKAELPHCEVTGQLSNHQNFTVTVIYQVMKVSEAHLIYLTIFFFLQERLDVTSPAAVVEVHK